jgi:hypothetical protein
VTDRVPSIYFLVPGPWRTVSEIVEFLETSGLPARPAHGGSIHTGELRVDLVEDPRGFGPAMAHGRQGPLPAEIVEAAGACHHAALLEFGFVLQDAPGVVAQAGQKLRDAGGVAIRSEASGGASTWEQWLPRLERGLASDLVTATVVVVGSDRGGLFTCGMHAFDLPDAEIERPDDNHGLEWLDALCFFQLDEQPVLATGHTFRPDADTPPRRLERWPDADHDVGDGRHNPFGRWRLVPDDDQALRAEDPVPVIVPSLVAMLHAATQQQGRHLTQQEVTALLDKAPAIAMAAKDQRAMELSRGYADLEPRRAWEQWELVRDRR